MVSTAWVANKLNPYARWLKVGAIILAGALMYTAGWTVNGWRLGTQMAQLESDLARKETARQTALTARQAKAIHDALEATTRSQAALALARKDNARLTREAAQKAPTAPEYACRDLPLPTEYVQEFLQ
jgi:hypothetical protein